MAGKQVPKAGIVKPLFSQPQRKHPRAGRAAIQVGWVAVPPAPIFSIPAGRVQDGSEDRGVIGCRLPHGNFDARLLPACRHLSQAQRTCHVYVIALTQIKNRLRKLITVRRQISSYSN
jgi:hypothetical protein